MPPKIILGPITGGVYHYKANNISTFIRKYIFPVFYQISKIIINIRYNNVIFSTNMLKYLHLRKNIKKIYNFNLSNLYIPKKINIKKKYDFIFYNNKHPNKKSKLIIILVKKLAELRYKICIVGDKIFYPNIYNFSDLSSEEIKKKIQASKFFICSGENLYSLFALECVSNNLIGFYDKKIKIKPSQPIEKKINLHLISININNIDSSIKIIIKKINKYKKNKFFFYDLIKKIKLEYFKFISSTI